MSIIIRMAEERDLDSIMTLLAGSGVHTGGVAENIGQFLVVEEEQGVDKSVVGTVGLEIYEGKYGLMRSMVMQSEAWNAKVGLELIRLFLAYAETTKIEELYLLTLSTASPFFIHMGFSTAEKEQIPTEIASSQHFSAYANEQVIAMVKKYASTSYPQAGVDSVSN